MGRKVKWKPGFSCPVSAEVAVQRIEHLRSQSLNGRIEPARIVDDARPKNAVLHPCFEWTDKIAAELHRQDQARRLVRSVEIVHVADDGKKTREIAYVSTAEPFQEGTAGYAPTDEVMGNEESREIALGIAWSQQLAWQRRWGRLVAQSRKFTGILAAIEDAAAIEAEAPVA